MGTPEEGRPDRSDHRTVFAAAADGFVELVRHVGSEQWSLPALGEWDVRSLVGHAARALSTVESSLGHPVDGPALPGPVEYFLAVLGDSADPEERRRLDAAIAERGRESGAALGDDPAGTVASLAARVVALVGATGDDILVDTRAGTMTLAGYLPTRTFELAVHGLDLAHTLCRPPPSALEPAVAASCRLAGQLASRRPNAADALLLLTGRGGPKHTFNIL
ncbi:MAG: maleylpyruvate isomerase N-terminal domain-containing protein [Acidimicrobiales bacterium]